MAARQITKTEITNPDTHETFHFVTDFVEHLANLPINSLTQDNAQTRKRD